MKHPGHAAGPADHYSYVRSYRSHLVAANHCNTGRFPGTHFFFQEGNKFNKEVARTFEEYEKQNGLLPVQSATHF